MIQEEREEGEQRKAQEVARKALAEGTDPKFVSKITGLTLKEVKKLAKDLA